MVALLVVVIVQCRPGIQHVHILVSSLHSQAVDTEKNRIEIHVQIFDSLFQKASRDQSDRVRKVLH